MIVSGDSMAVDAAGTVVLLFVIVAIPPKILHNNTILYLFAVKSGT
jgi:hypothetical protein